MLTSALTHSSEVRPGQPLSNCERKTEEKRNRERQGREEGSLKVVVELCDVEDTNTKLMCYSLYTAVLECLETLYNSIF